MTDCSRLKILARKVLYEHVIEYPKKTGVQPIVQQTGQLMGSPLSFPILCIVNMLCHWITLYPNEENPERVPSLVNGDDIAFFANQKEYDAWSAAIKEFGFVKSVGKNYCHGRYCLINSELFSCTRHKEGVRVRQLPFFASGLLLGRSKVAEAIGGDTVEKPPVVTTLEICLKGSNDPTRTLSRFMFYHKDKVESVTRKKLNPFLPMSRGGLGIKPYGARKWSDRKGRFVPAEDASLWQGKYATWLSEQETCIVPHYERDAIEAGQWRNVYAIPVKRETHVEHWPRNPNAIASGFGLRQTTEAFQCTKTYKREISARGPPGWRMLDTGATARWKTRFPKFKKLRAVEVMSQDMIKNELVCRFQLHRSGKGEPSPRQNGFSIHVESPRTQNAGSAKSLPQ
jgi:hypothetical protein